MIVIVTNWSKSTVLCRAVRVTVNKKTVVADINGAGTSGRVDIIGRAVACAVVRYWPAAHDEHVAVPGRHGKRELAREQRKRERTKFTSKAKKERKKEILLADEKRAIEAAETGK